MEALPSSGPGSPHRHLVDLTISHHQSLRVCETPASRSGPDGGIGRHDGLKIRCPQGREGSSPSPGTRSDLLRCRWRPSSEISGGPVNHSFVTHTTETDALVLIRVSPNTRASVHPIALRCPYCRHMSTLDRVAPANENDFDFSGTRLGLRSCSGCDPRADLRPRMHHWMSPEGIQWCIRERHGRGTRGCGCRTWRRCRRSAGSRTRTRKIVKLRPGIDPSEPGYNLARVDDSLIAEICVAVSLAAIALIIIAPWRRVRDEPRLKREVQARLLLGDDPDEVAADADAAEQEELAHRPDPPVELPHHPTT